MSVFALLDTYPGMELLGHRAVLFFSFCFPHSGYTNVHALQQGTRVPFAAQPRLVICVLFDDGHSDRCEVITHHGFDLRFPDD